MPLTLTCRNCGQVYHRARGDEGRGLYCSRVCARAKQPRRTLAERLWRRVARGEGCWEWQGQRVVDGYGRIVDYSTGRMVRLMVHRVSYELTYGSIPAGLQVCHTCDNPPCVRPDHLYAGTQAQNIRDRDDRGRRQALRGSMNPRAILTEDKVREIRRRAAQGERPGIIGFDYGVSRSAIRRILEGKNWRHVE